MSGLTHEIAGKCRSVLSYSLQQGAVMHELSEVAKGLKHPRLSQLVTELQSVQCSLQAECNVIKITLGAEAMVSGLPRVPTVRPQDLELHPLNWPGHGRALALERLEDVEPDEEIVSGHHRAAVMESQRAPTADELERMERSLHRVGDHTLDRDDTTDLNDDGEGVR